jgi:putative nucleotidyltransferase with HDIG domain
MRYRRASPSEDEAPGPVDARALIAFGREHELAGRLREASDQYADAARRARDAGDAAREAEALRRLGVAYHRRGEGPDQGRSLCRQSHDVAMAAGLPVPAAEALNCLAGFELEQAAYDSARTLFSAALELGGCNARLRGRIRQNLGVMANIRGDLDEALAHYLDALSAFESSDDRQGMALVYHNLGMISADRRQWGDADRYYRQSSELAAAQGDVQLRGLCLLNHTEVFLAQQQYAAARHSAEAALQVFDELGSADGKAAAYRFLGMLYRETGEPAMAEARLRGSIELARDGAFPLEEAESLRELALLFQQTGRNQDSLRSLDHAHRLFRRLEANLDMVDVASRASRLEETYLVVVRNWGQSIESADRYTFGHCERVAGYAEAVARALGLDALEQTTIRVGAYLHDVGKVRVPHEILNKPGPLTADEFRVMQDHTIHGVELLASIQFPWDIKPIIRSHHERADGRGYPDALRGEEIPLSAQIIGIVDVWDALTTDRSYRKAMLHEAALEQMAQCRGWWRESVYGAFMAAVGTPAPRIQPQATSPQEQFRSTALP